MSLLSISVTRTDVQEQLVTKGIADNVLTERTQMSQDSSKEIFLCYKLQKFLSCCTIKSGMCITCALFSPTGAFRSMYNACFIVLCVSSVLSAGVASLISFMIPKIPCTCRLSNKLFHHEIQGKTHDWIKF